MKIETLNDLATVLKMDDWEKKYPTPPYGAGGDVVELDKTYSRMAILMAAKALTDDKLAEVIHFKTPINFHNNMANGHMSEGAMWTMKYFLEYDGGKEFREKIKQL